MSAAIEAAFGKWGPAEGHISKDQLLKIFIELDPNITKSDLREQILIPAGYKNNTLVEDMLEWCKYYYEPPSQDNQAAASVGGGCGVQKPLPGGDGAGPPEMERIPKPVRWRPGGG
eukprot:gnl/MRDRNA2_/MRDRNA2_56462_c0_seq1.p1 gnl/MRDRNA2_/MRDRNA2_56462_c0~~gnl/MRDRNA2_/MRDRNA2_56462_c0_seq1.p1  ORF type:complete len:116 (+),score=30.30 gnl/MRDRNA2_/MRDRNA2_56462_c0_seq1:86-433(+)